MDASRTARGEWGRAVKLDTVFALGTGGTFDIGCAKESLLSLENLELGPFVPSSSLLAVTVAPLPLLLGGNSGEVWSLFLIVAGEASFTLEVLLPFRPCLLSPALTLLFGDTSIPLARLLVLDKGTWPFLL